MTLHKQVKTNSKSLTSVYFILVVLSFCVFVLIMCLYSLEREYRQDVKQLRTELRVKNKEIEKIQNENSARDLVLRALNREYQLREAEKAEEAKRIADNNRVGG